MSLVKWDPFREMGTLRNDLNRFFTGWNGNALGPLETWTPSVDVAENEKEIRIKVELPEVDKKDIDVSIDGDVLTVSGERHLEKEEKKEEYTRVERSYGSFFRSFTIPPNIDRNSIKADSKNGVLKLTLHKIKPEKSETKKVAIE
jgi:HSP20 family protein